MTDYKLSDNVIGNIVQLLQLSMVTGTDISDHFRMITLTPSKLSPDKLELSPEYVKAHEERIQKMVAEAEKLAKAQENKSQNGSAGFVS